MSTDPIADMLARMRNAMARKYDSVDVPASKLKERILEIMKREGFVRGFSAERDAEDHPVIRIRLRYVGEDRPVINGLRRVSRPGRRVYVKRDAIRSVRGGLGIAVISTPQGLMTDRESRKRNVGGEVLCMVW
jgi:small subunit ribosomal protein S8